MSNNETKWIKLNEINNIKKTIYQNEKNKNSSKNKNKDNNISLVTQRVKINISKKASTLPNDSAAPLFSLTPAKYPK